MIEKIIIKTYSGLCPFNDAYEDEYIITNEAISYSYTPVHINVDSIYTDFEIKSVSTHNFYVNYQSLVREILDIINIHKMLTGIDNHNFIDMEDAGGFDITLIDENNIDETYTFSGTLFESIMKFLIDLIPNYFTTPSKEDYINSLKEENN